MPTAITHDPTFTTPVSSTNTAVVRWSGTAGAVLQDSGVLIDGSNNLIIPAQGDLRLSDTTGGQYVALQAAGTTTSHTLTLPATQGSADTFLKNNGSGALTWAAATTAFIGCRAKSTGAQTIPHNTQTALVFQGEDFKAGITHSTSSNTEQFTIATAGYYHMNLSGRFNGAGDYIVVAGIITVQPSGGSEAQIAYNSTGGPSNSNINDPTFCASAIYSLAVNDVVRFKVNHYGGSASRNTVTASGTSSIAEIWKIG